MPSFLADCNGMKACKNAVNQTSLNDVLKNSALEACGGSAYQKSKDFIQELYNFAVPKAFSISIIDSSTQIMLNGYYPYVIYQRIN